MLGVAVCLLVVVVVVAVPHPPPHNLLVAQVHSQNEGRARDSPGREVRLPLRVVQAARVAGSRAVVLGARGLGGGHANL